MGLFGKSKEELLLGAAKCGELREVRAALNKGASVNCKDWVRRTRRDAAGGPWGPCGAAGLARSRRRW
jgi:hypothetical protein